MGNYRITKKSKRDSKNATITHSFFVEEFVPKSFLCSSYWKECTRVVAEYTEFTLVEPTKFATLKGAKKYYNSLITPVPVDEVVYP